MASSDIGGLYPTIKLKSLQLRNYRAFSNACLDLSDLTVLVGRNGAGKSTLLDAFDFLREAMTDSLVVALERRDGLAGLRKRRTGKGAPQDLAVVLNLTMGKGNFPASYGFRLGATRAGFQVKEERLVIEAEPTQYFSRKGKSFEASGSDLYPEVDEETLVFPLIAGANKLFLAIHRTIRTFSVHQFSPPALHAEPLAGISARLSREGSNLGDILSVMEKKHSRQIKWITRHLKAILPGLVGLETGARAGRRVIRFDQEAEDGEHLPFYANQMSDGTLRALGILTALAQRPKPSLVLVDEIEDAIHPAACGALLDAIESTLENSQVVITTHSPEVLSHPLVTGKRVRVVEWEGGSSHIYRLSRSVLKALKPPETVGRLLRSNALWHDTVPSEGDLFEGRKASL